MRSVILLVTAVLIAPAALAAQNPGFAVGIPSRDGATVIVLPGPGGVPGGVLLFLVPPRFGGTPGEPPNGGGSPSGSGARDVVPKPGASIIGPPLTPGSPVHPRHPTAIPSHPVATPDVFPSPITGRPAPPSGAPGGAGVIRRGSANAPGSGGNVVFGIGPH